MKKLILTLLLIFLTTSLNAKTLRVAIETWTPFVYFENDTPKGLTIDIFNNLAKELNMDVEFIKIPWTRALRMLKNGNIDAMGNLSYSQKREKYIQYIQPSFYKLKTNFYTLKGNENLISSYSDLYNYTILTAKGYLYFPKFDTDAKISKEVIHDRIEKNSQIIEEEIMLKMLLAKRVKVIISSNAIMDFIIEFGSFKNLVKKANYAPNYIDPIYVGISKQSPFIKDINKINKAMEKILNK